MKECIRHMEFHVTSEYKFDNATTKNWIQFWTDFGPFLRKVFKTSEKNNPELSSASKRQQICLIWQIAKFAIYYIYNLINVEFAKFAVC